MIIIYVNIFSLQTSEREAIWILRTGIAVEGAAAAMLAISVHSIYGLFVFCTDLVFVILFPQLLSVLYIPMTNSYGSLVGFLCGAFFRLIGGEPLLNVPALLDYGFAYKTLNMCISLASIVTASYLASATFRSGWLSPRADVFKCFTSIDAVVDSQDGNAAAMVKHECNLNGNEDDDTRTKL